MIMLLRILGINLGGGINCLCAFMVRMKNRRKWRISHMIYLFIEPHKTVQPSSCGDNPHLNSKSKYPKSCSLVYEGAGCNPHTILPSVRIRSSIFSPCQEAVERTLPRSMAILNNPICE
jgi:hypothetical protein